MGTIIAGYGVNHTPDFTVPGGEIDEKTKKSVFGAFDRIKKELEELKPDLLLFFTPDHLMNFQIELMPHFSIGVAEKYFGPREVWLNIEKKPIPGVYDISKRTLHDLIDHQFDMTRFGELTFDHGLVTPLHFIRPNFDIPVLPVIINCGAEPLPSLSRCYELGRTIGDSLRNNPDAGRVVVVGSGGISHHVGTVKMKQIDEEFDRMFLDDILNNRIDKVFQYDPDRISAAGNGAEEVRNWVAMAGALGDYRGRLLCYEPSPEWITGIGMCSFKPAHSAAAV